MPPTSAQFKAFILRQFFSVKLGAEVARVNLIYTINIKLNLGIFCDQTSTWFATSIKISKLTVFNNAAIKKYGG